MARSVPNRVLAVAVTSRGYGFALMEGPENLVDWGVTQPRPYRETRCLDHLRRTIDRYGPDLLLLEDPATRRRSCSARVGSLHTRIHGLAARTVIPLRAIAWHKVRSAFCPTGRITKHGIAQATAKLLPELAPRLPRYRKPWMSEDYRMAMFEAAALALTYYQSLPTYRSHIHKPQSHA